MNVDIENTKEGRYGGTGLESQHSEMCRQEDHKFESSVGNLPIQQEPVLKHRRAEDVAKCEDPEFNTQYWKAKKKEKEKANHQESIYKSNKQD